GPQGCARSAPDHHALFAPGGDPGGEGGPDRHVPRRRAGRADRGVRGMPGGAHGRARRGRGLPEHDQPQLPWAHGPPESAGLSLQPGGRRRKRRDRRDQPSERGARAHARRDPVSRLAVVFAAWLSMVPATAQAAGPSPDPEALQKMLVNAPDSAWIESVPGPQTLEGPFDAQSYSLAVYDDAQTRTDVTQHL